MRQMSQRSRRGLLSLSDSDDSIQVELDLNHHLHSYRMALIQRRLELVLPHCFDGFFIQAHSEVTEDADILRVPVRIADELEGAAAWEVRGTSILCDLRLNGVHDNGRADPAADAHDAAAIATAAAWSGSAAVAHSNTTTDT